MMEQRGMRNLVLLCTLMCAAFGVALSAKSCNLLKSSKNGFKACQMLPKLSSTLAWTIHNETNKIDFAFSGTAPVASGWVGWGINPTAAAMVGTQALIAFQSGQGAIVHSYAITGPIKGGAPCVPGNLSLDFTGTSVEISGTEITIFATLTKKSNGSWTMNHVWNEGSTVDLDTNAIGPHAMSGDSVASASIINLETNEASGDVELPHQKLKDRHAIISAVGWGMLLPLGIMAARYLRPLSQGSSAWFYIHVTCQCTGYILGVAAWVLGMKLHSYNHGAVPTKHRNIGISIFAMATLQVTALALRPKPESKLRNSWNVYHHSIGYAIIILIIINIFEGLDLLRPGVKWTNTYIVFLIVLGVISLVLEVIIWSMWLRQRSKSNADPVHVALGKAMGSNAYRNPDQKTMDIV